MPDRSRAAATVLCDAVAHLVVILRGGLPSSRVPSPFDFTWALVPRAGPDGTTRPAVSHVGR